MNYRIQSFNVVIFAIIATILTLSILFCTHSYKRFIKVSYNQSEWVTTSSTNLFCKSKEGKSLSFAVGDGTKLTPIGFLYTGGKFASLVELPSGERCYVDPDQLSGSKHSIKSDLKTNPILDTRTWNSFIYADKRGLDGASLESIESKYGDAHTIYKSGASVTHFYPQIALIEDNLIYDGAFITFVGGKVVEAKSLDKNPLDTWLVKMPLFKSVIDIFYPNLGSIYHEKVTDSFNLKWMWNFPRWILNTLFRLFIAFPFLVLGVPFLFCYAFAFLLAILFPKASSDTLQTILYIICVIPLFIYAYLLALFLQPIWVLSLALSLIVVFIAPLLAFNTVAGDRCEKCLKYNFDEVMYTETNKTHRVFSYESDGENKTSCVKMKKTIFCTEHIICMACGARGDRNVKKKDVEVMRYDTVDGFQRCPWWIEYNVKDKQGNQVDPYKLRVAKTNGKDYNGDSSEGSSEYKEVCRLYNSRNNECKHRSIIQYEYCPCKGDLGIHSTCPYKAD